MATERDASKPGGSRSANVLDQDLWAAVRRSLDPLLRVMDPELREVFQRAEFRGETCEVIALSLRISIDEAEARLSRAHAKIRQLIEISARSYLDHAGRS